MPELPDTTFMHTSSPCRAGRSLLRRFGWIDTLRAGVLQVLAGLLVTAAVSHAQSGSAEGKPGAGSSDRDPSLSVMRDQIERYSTDAAGLGRYHSVANSEKRTERLRRFYEERLRGAETVDFDSLDQDGRVDYLLFRNQLRFELSELED